MLTIHYGTANDQRQALYRILHKRPIVRHTRWSPPYIFTIGNCLLLGALFVRAEGRAPMVCELSPSKHLPSFNVIKTHFKNVSAYQRAVLAIAGEV